MRSHPLLVYHPVYLQIILLETLVPQKDHLMLDSAAGFLKQVLRRDELEIKVLA